VFSLRRLETTALLQGLHARSARVLESTPRCQNKLLYCNVLVVGEIYAGTVLQASLAEGSAGPLVLWRRLSQPNSPSGELRLACHQFYRVAVLGIVLITIVVSEREQIFNQETPEI
jgi:hypothetical protein